MDYPNVDPVIGAIVSEKQATLQELKTVYSLEDMYDMWEVIAVNRYNEAMAVEAAKKNDRNR